MNQFKYQVIIKLIKNNNPNNPSIVAGTANFYNGQPLELRNKATTYLNFIENTFFDLKCLREDDPKYLKIDENLLDYLRYDELLISLHLLVPEKEIPVINLYGHPFLDETELLKELNREYKYYKDHRYKTNRQYEIIQIIRGEDKIDNQILNFFHENIDFVEFFLPSDKLISEINSYPDSFEGNLFSLKKRSTLIRIK